MKAESMKSYEDVDMFPCVLNLYTEKGKLSMLDHDEVCFMLIVKMIASNQQHWHQHPKLPKRTLQLDAERDVNHADPVEFTSTTRNPKWIFPALLYEHIILMNVVKSCRVVVKANRFRETMLWMLSGGLTIRLTLNTALVDSASPDMLAGISA